MELIDLAYCPIRDYPGIGRHQHLRFWEFHYFLSGDAVFRQRQSQIMRPGTLHLSPPGHPHEIHRTGNDPGAPCLFFFAQASPENREESALFDHLARRFSGARVEPIGLAHQDAWERLTGLYQTREMAHIEAARHGFLSFIYEISIEKSTKGSLGHPLVAAALRAMEEAVALGWNLKGLAARLQVHPSTLVREFQKERGVTPHHHFNQLRVHRARVLLSEKKDRLGEIARQLGFYDAFHFSKTFKQFTGCSPREYRAREARGHRRR